MENSANQNTVIGRLKEHWDWHIGGASFILVGSFLVGSGLLEADSVSIGDQCRQALLQADEAALSRIPTDSNGHLVFETTDSNGGTIDCELRAQL